MAIAADGTAWVADPTVSGNSQNVYQLDKTGAVVGQPTTIASTPRGGCSSLMSPCKRRAAR
uniref:Uncharacterized protein n=1 Tax=blood disease bacterium R229 TaxID=741978 RepID=G2ZY17_9RALS|nr:hypothetical protein BDB_mp90003 [blood disease bacterium R229]